MTEERGNISAPGGNMRDVLNGAARGLFQRTWWAIALRGLLGIVLGVVLLRMPGVGLAAFLATLGVYFFLDGILALIATFHAAHDKRSWWPYLLSGIVSIGVGILVFARPAVAALGVLLLISVRCMVTGVVEISTAVALHRSSGSSQWALWLAGLASIVFGGLLLARPAAGIVSLVWLAGIYCLFFGITATITAFQTRSLGKRVLAHMS